MAALLFASRTAEAEPATFDLAWSAPPGCPSRQEILDATRSRLGASRTDAPPVLFVQGTVRPEGGGFLVDLAMKDASGNPVGERQVHVEGQSCSAVAEPTALVLAMIIAARRLDEPADAPPQAGGETLLPPPTSAPIDRESPAPSGRPVLVPSAPPSPKEAPRRLVLGASGVASRGLLPVAGLGIALRATYAPLPLALFGLEASFEVGGSIRSGTGEVGFQLAGGSVFTGLPVLETSRFELILTLGARAGVIRMSPVGFPVVENDMRAVVLVGPGGLARLKLAQALFLEALPQVEAVVVRDRFQLRDSGTMYPIHRPALVTARFSLGIGYEFQ